MSKYQTTLSSVKCRLLVYLNHVMNFRLILTDCYSLSCFIIEIVFKMTETVVLHIYLECKLKFKNCWIDLRNILESEVF